MVTQCSFQKVWKILLLTKFFLLFMFGCGYRLVHVHVDFVRYFGMKIYYKLSQFSNCSFEINFRQIQDLKKVEWFHLKKSSFFFWLGRKKKVNNLSWYHLKLTYKRTWTWLKFSRMEKANFNMDKNTIVTPKMLWLRCITYTAEWPLCWCSLCCKIHLIFDKIRNYLRAFPWKLVAFLHIWWDPN